MLYYFAPMEGLQDMYSGVFTGNAFREWINIHPVFNAQSEKSHDAKRKQGCITGK